MIYSDDVFFVMLRGDFRAFMTRKNRDLDDEALKNATLTITLKPTYVDGTVDDARTYTVPLQTRAYNQYAHLAIRNEAGKYVQHLSKNGVQDIMADMVIMKQFLQTADWEFEIVAQLEDETCLFAFTLTQRLEGSLSTHL